MAFYGFGINICRGRVHDSATGLNIATHTYKYESDTLAAIATAGYFPDYFGAAEDEVLVNDILIARGSDGVDTFTITSLSPLTIEPQAEATGNVTGPISSTNTAIPRYTDTTGKVLGNTGVLIDGSNNLSAATVTAASLTATGQTSKVGNAVTSAETVFHVQSVADATVWIEGDTANAGSETEFARVLFSQDTNNSACYIGFDGDNQLLIGKSGTSSPVNDIVFKTGMTVTNGGTAGTQPTLSSGTAKLTIPAIGGPLVAANVVGDVGFTGSNFTFATSASNPGSTATLWVNSSNGHLMFGATDLTP